MENSNKSITMAEKRVGEMNKLTQGFLEQSNRCLRQMEQPQSAQDKQFQNRPSAPPRQNVQQNMPQNVPNRNNTVQNSMPNSQLQRQNVPFQNNSPRNMQRNAPNQPQKPRFEAVGNGRQSPPQHSHSRACRRACERKSRYEAYIGIAVYFILRNVI